MAQRHSEASWLGLGFFHEKILVFHICKFCILEGPQYGLKPLSRDVYFMDWVIYEITLAMCHVQLSRVWAILMTMLRIDLLSQLT